jgi:hypothetical protein
VKTGFSERDKCKPVLLRLSLAGNLEKTLMPLYGTEWKERGYGLGGSQMQGGKTGFSERDKCKPVLLGLSLAGNLEKPLMSLYGTEYNCRLGDLNLPTEFWQCWPLNSLCEYFVS